MAGTPPPHSQEGCGPTAPPRSHDVSPTEQRPAPPSEGAPGERAEERGGQPVRLGRILVRRDFLRVAARQTKAVTPGLILQAAPSPPPGPPRRRTGGVEARPGTRPEANEDGGARVGFTVSRKVGNAVARNRARRRLRAAVEAVFPDAVQPGLDYVVIGRAATVERPFTDLLNDLRSAVKRVTAAVRSGKPGRDVSHGPARQASTKGNRQGTGAQHRPPPPKAETQER